MFRNGILVDKYYQDSGLAHAGDEMSEIMQICDRPLEAAGNTCPKWMHVSILRCMKLKSNALDGLAARCSDTVKKAVIRAQTYSSALGSSIQT